MPERKIPILLCGLPGRMCAEVAAALAERPGEFALLDPALVGPETAQAEIAAAGRTFQAVRPEAREAAIAALEAQRPFFAVDYTLPDAIRPNVEFYCRHKIPFVMGTTGGDTEWIRAQVERAGLVAIVAPNMAIPIVLLQAAAQWLAATFPGALTGYKASIRESHQSGKKDTSGTAKALAANLSALGAPVRVEDIEKVRDPQAQLAMGVPREHLAGHAFHTYRAASPDGAVELALSHNILGRRVYAEGTLWALRFLRARIEAGDRGKQYRMIDVLQNMNALISQSAKGDSAE